jgi:hypothetical protein
MELNNKSAKVKLIASGVIPFLFLIMLMAYIFAA